MPEKNVRVILHPFPKIKKTEFSKRSQDVSKGVLLLIFKTSEYFNIIPDQNEKDDKF